MSMRMKTTVPRNRHSNNSENGVDVSVSRGRIGERCRGLKIENTQVCTAAAAAWGEKRAFAARKGQTSDIDNRETQGTQHLT